MTKFNDKIINEILEYRRKGLTIESCAKAVKINPSTLTRWLARGREAQSGKYKTFYLEFQSASADYEAYHLAMIEKKAEKDWRAHQFLLQCMNKDYVIPSKVKSETTAKVEAKGELTNLQKFEKMMNRCFSPNKNKNVYDEGKPPEE